VTGEAIALNGTFSDAEGDAGERLAALFDAHHRRLYSLASRMCRTREDARDCVQETFLRAARRPAAVPRGAEEAWLVRVLVNICRDGWRRQAVRDRTPREVPPDSADQESEVIARSLVRMALDRLPPRRRAILVLHELEGEGIADIAKLLGVAPVTVRWHLSRGRKQMAVILAPRKTLGTLEGER
jgi:RNA polymerase sigma-70 factor (ECF subfamily)